MNCLLAAITIVEFLIIEVLDTSLATHMKAMSRDYRHTPMNIGWLCTPRWIHAHDISKDAK